MCAKRPVLWSKQIGVTLVELIVFIVILSIGLAGILGVMNQTIGASANPMQRKQAMSMAEAILEEVLAKSSTETLPETDLNACSNRALYVGVNDYACFDGAPATAVISGINTLGSYPTPVLAGFSATVVVAPVMISGVAMLRITVTVAGGIEGPIALSGYRATTF